MDMNMVILPISITVDYGEDQDPFESKQQYRMMNNIYSIFAFFFLFSLIISFLNSLTRRRNKQNQNGFYVRDEKGNVYFMSDNGNNEYQIYNKY